MDTKVLHSELTFRTSRSSGAGGQHVNKTETRVELLFDVAGSALLTAEQKALITERLAARVNQEGTLIVACQDTRSQQQNKELAIARFDDLIARALRPRKLRKATRPPRAVAEKRLQSKKQRSEKKAWRGKVREHQR